MASNDFRNPHIHYGKARIIYGWGEAATQSYEAGELLQDSSGSVAVAADDSHVLGIAQKDASGTTATEAPFIEIEPGDVVRFYVTSDGSTAALASTLTLGENYNHQVGSNLWVIDGGDTTNGQWTYIEPVLDVNGDSTYYGLFRLGAADSDILGA